MPNYESATRAHNVDYVLVPLDSKYDESTEALLERPDSLDSGVADDSVNGDDVYSDVGSTSDELQEQKVPPVLPCISLTKATKLKTLLSIVLVVLAMLMNDAALAWIHERVPQVAPMPDIWFDLFPEFPWAIKITEALILLAAGITIAMLLLHQYRWIVVRRVFLITALVYMGRAVCITVTQVSVPSRNTYCDPKVANITVGMLAKRIAWIFTGLGMDMYHNRVLCGDLIYSGHTITFMISYLSVAQYMPNKFRFMRCLMKLLVAVGLCCILLARKHYTLDIMIAYYITTRVYWIYHTMVELKFHFKRSPKSTALSNVLWFPLFEFMESDVKWPIQNEF